MSCVIVVADQGIVGSFGSLPLAGNALGDYYMAADTGIQYAWQSAAAAGPSTNWEPINAEASGGGSSDDSRSFQMGLQGRFNQISLPFTDIGINIVDKADTLLNFRARRGIAGSSGTTTIQFELNGSPVVGATLSWIPADADMALKSIAIAVAITSGDRISFRLISKETGGQNIYAEVD
jgi:hypothetical protein